MRLLSGSRHTLSGVAASAALALLAGGASAQTASLGPVAGACRVAPGAAPQALRACFFAASIRASRAARHLVSFETRTDVDRGMAAAYAGAAAEATDALVELAGSPAGKSALAAVTSVAVVVGDEPSATLSGGALVIAIAPAKGAAGLPTTGQIERTLTP